MLSAFAKVAIDTDEARRAFDSQPTLLDAVANGLPLARYQAFLLELYSIVWHFNPVCAVAASRMPDSLRDVRYFLYEHMHEEAGHEIWVMNDLAAVGVPASVLATQRPGPYTQGMIGYNHWSAAQRHPASVLGMMYVLEVIASVYGSPFSTAVRESLKLDGKLGTSFISSHATMDSEHIAELRKVIEKIEAQDAIDAIIESAQFNFHHFGQLFANLPQ
jgi:pyrroloquinoline quinone (PQQ) biosynthesis protein C